MTTEPTAQGDSVPYPEDDAAFERLAADAARLRRDIEHNEKLKKDRIAEVNKRFDEKAKPLNEQLERMSRVLVAYAKANRKRLTDGGKRQSIETSDAIIAFRKDGAGTLEVTDEATAIASLEKRAGGKEFIKVEKSIKKDPLKRWLKESARRRVPGVRVLFKNSLRIELKLTAAEKRRKVKPTVLVREIDD